MNSPSKTQSICEQEFKDWEEKANQLAKLSAELESSLSEINEICGMLLSQNSGRWNPDKEHEMRARNIVQRVVDIANKTLH